MKTTDCGELNCAIRMSNPVRTGKHKMIYIDQVNFNFPTDTIEAHIYMLCKIRNRLLQ